MASELPACGLYKTGLPLPDHEEQVPAGILVYFHNHSDQGPPMVQTPHSNTHNRWQFHERGWAVSDTEFLAALVPLKAEGLYTNPEHLHVSREEVIPQRSLMQLGYNRGADSLLFIGRFQDNTIAFPEQGYSFTTADIQARLEPVSFQVPKLRDADALH
jgi:hypothetical protein